MALTVAHPVQTLREHATAFEAALSVCLGNPRPRAVHKLRTASRRLEAQIVLLETLRGLPPYRRLAEKVLKQVARFRRAAGNVRDLDVQTKLLQDHGKRKTHPPDTDGAPVDAAFVAQRAADLQTMIATRAQRRETVAAELVALVEKRQGKVAIALEQLVSALKPAEALRLPAAELVKIAHARFGKQRALKQKEPSDEALHTIRKAAKQARYLAETSGSRVAVEAAQRYEHLQEAGGKWHDFLDLAHDSAKELGDKHAVTIEFSELRDRRLVSYRELLEQFR